MRSRRAFSLRGRLLTLLLASMGMAWIGVVAFSYRDARHEIREMLDAHLAQSAALLIAQSGHEVFEDDDHKREVHIAAPAHRYERNVAFQIWEDGARLRLRSASAPLTRLAERDEGFNDVRLEDKRWRVYSRWDETRQFLVQVGERYEFRDELAKKISGNLLDPLWVALPALALLIWIGVGQGLRPLRRVNLQLAQRAPERLDPLDGGRAPREVQPLIDTLNDLLARVRAALDKERRFTADAAHELRTPLAALKTQAQVARAAQDDATRRHALDQVLAGCDRASHLVEQMLTLARLDPQSAAARHAAVDLRSVAAQVVADIAPVALAKDIDLGLADGPALAVKGDAVMLVVLLRNLVDNAVRYTQRGGEVGVAIEAQGSQARIVVTDNGPGIAPDERTKVGQRFYRVLGSEESGSGLGLSIVRRICDLHGAVMSLDSLPAGSGLRATVILPRLATIPSEGLRAP